MKNNGWKKSKLNSTWTVTKRGILSCATKNVIAVFAGWKMTFSHKESDEKD